MWAAKFRWCPLLECRSVTLRRRKTRWNYLGCTKLTKQSQPLVTRSSPYCKDMWGRYCCLTSFFRLSIRALVRRYSLTKLCDGAQMASFWRFFASCIFSEPRVDIQSATAEIRRGKENRRKKKERKKKPQDENIISAPATQGGYKKNWNKNRVAQKKRSG